MGMSTRISAADLMTFWTINDLIRHDEIGHFPGHYWTATVHYNDHDYKVHNKYGSWMCEDENGMHDVLPELAADLQNTVMKTQKKIDAILAGAAA